MDFHALLEEIRAAPDYADQMVYVRDVPARASRFAEPARPLPDPVRAMLAGRGITRLYAHQAEALDRARAGQDVVIVTGTASGKSLCYTAPLLEMLLADPEAKALLLFPTKALCQDQFRAFQEALAGAGMGETLAGVFDGDSPADSRRRLRDHASVLFSNPDMVHAALMPQHARWAPFLSQLRLLVLDEMHVYNGIFGSNMTNLLRRFFRLCRHYGSDPRVVACSATIGNPGELAARLVGRPVAVVDDDGSPRGRRTYVFWNPPRVRHTTWRSRRSANVEAHDLMAMLVQRGVPTITFSKAKMTAEMIHRYVCERLRETTPHLAGKVSPYRGGYLPEERREIERRLFSGELLGVSTTPALELGIDVGGLDASILVGYPGTLASFFQQSGRAGRQERDSLVVLVGLDTAVNQYVLSHPEYLFGRPVEQAVIDPDNPFIITGHLRCAAHELALPDTEAGLFGPYVERVLRVLQENLKVRHIGDRWYHAASETPQHEVTLRDTADANVAIEDVATGAVIGEVNEFDGPTIVHPEAIYMHQGDTYRVLELDMEKHVARVQRVDVDYYTQPLGGTDVHHIDHCLREKPFGAGHAYWGEVTAYFHTAAYERVRFYELDAISRHGLEMPTYQMETMAFWIVPPEELMREVLRAGLDAHNGLRGVGYATRMILPLFVTCDTADFSHSVGSANSPWNSLFIYERFPHGMGFTEKAFGVLHLILPAVLDAIRSCPCEEGCPCCVGKPLRQFTVWNVERGEASIPSKAAAVMILEGMLGVQNAECRMQNAEWGGQAAVVAEPDTQALSDSDEADGERLERALRRRLERLREPRVFHPIEPNVPTQYPAVEAAATLGEADVGRRAGRRRDFDKELRKRVAQKLEAEGLSPGAPVQHAPAGTHRPGGVLPPGAFSPHPPVPSPGGTGEGEIGVAAPAGDGSTVAPGPAGVSGARPARPASTAGTLSHPPAVPEGAAGVQSAGSGSALPERPAGETPTPPAGETRSSPPDAGVTIRLGDALAAAARRVRKQRQNP